MPAPQTVPMRGVTVRGWGRPAVRRMTGPPPTAGRSVAKRRRYLSNVKFDRFDGYKVMDVMAAALVLLLCVLAIVWLW